MAREAVRKHRITVRLACASLDISETFYRYLTKLGDENAAIADRLIRLTQWRRDWGCGLRILFLLEVKVYGWNHKRVCRIYRELEFNMRIKPRKRLIREKPEPLAVPGVINKTWSMDFMHDQLAEGHSYRLFNVIDDYNRQGLGVDVDLSLPSSRVVRALDQIIERRGKPRVVRCDKGPEYISES